MTRFAAATTSSAVKPSSLCRALIGAEAPNVIMPICSPSSPIKDPHVSFVAASMETRARHEPGRTLSWYSALCCLNSSTQGTLTKRTAQPSAFSMSYACTMRATSLPVAMRINSNGSSVSLRMYAPLDRPLAGANTERSSVGNAWRDKTTAAGSCVRVMITFHISSTSLASQGRNVNKPGTERNAARCSIGWCVGPSSPTPIESWVKIQMHGISIIEAIRIGGFM
mmetsp:Transcript_52932/g.137943  ORF Transcript_52932/g.137943 Transcript_52932/m.137943 type:complete len:225 (+) Transcript_52932:281-955(+)